MTPVGFTPSQPHEQQFVWPTEDQLAEFERTLPPPEKLIGLNPESDDHGIPPAGIDSSNKLYIQAPGTGKRYEAHRSEAAKPTTQNVSQLAVMSPFVELSTAAQEIVEATETQSPPIETAALSREQKIKRYSSIANTTSSVWLYTDAKQPALESRISGFSYTSDPSLRPVKSSPELWEETKQYPTLLEFMKKGIYETCTLQQLHGWDHPRYESEKIYGLVYEASGWGYEDGSGRDGSVMWVKFLLPESVARQLWRDARKDPTILRDMSERYIKKHVLSDTGKAPGGDWDTYGRPPYEKWDARPQNTMAFRHNFDEGPSDIPASRMINVHSATS